MMTSAPDVNCTVLCNLLANQIRKSVRTRTATALRLMNATRSCNVRGWLLLSLFLQRKFDVVFTNFSLCLFSWLISKIITSGLCSTSTKSVGQDNLERFKFLSQINKVQWKLSSIDLFSNKNFGCGIQDALNLCMSWCGPEALKATSDECGCEPMMRNIEKNKLKWLACIENCVLSKNSHRRHRTQNESTDVPVKRSHRMKKRRRHLGSADHCPFWLNDCPWNP